MSNVHIASSILRRNISPDEIAAAKSALLNVLPTKLKRAGNLLVGLCPFHDEHTPSFTVYPDWHYYCFGCGVSGDAITYLRRQGLDFGDAVRQLTGRVEPIPPQGPHACGNAPGTAATAPRSVSLSRLAQRLWREATSPDLVRHYLDTRRIAQKPLPEALRGHREVWSTEAGERQPAVLAAITDARGTVTAIQRTWIEDRLVYDGATTHTKGARSTTLSAPKKTLGPMGSGAVKLAAAGAILGLSEGVESALAAAQLFQIPTWATCGGERLGSVELPPIVRHVVIFADAGAAGERQAAKAESIYARRGYGCQVELPSAGKGDFAEVLL